jgi:hypothetical protein
VENTISEYGIGKMINTEVAGIDTSDHGYIHLVPTHEDSREPILVDGVARTFCGKRVEDVNTTMPSEEVPDENICPDCLAIVNKLGLSR